MEAYKMTGEIEVCQGELKMTVVDSIPEGLEPLELTNGEYMIGVSNSGSPHLAPAGGITVYKESDTVMYVPCTNDTVMRHLGSSEQHTHRSVEFLAGLNYRVVRGRMHTPDGLAPVID